MRSYGAWLGSPARPSPDSEDRTVAEAVEPGPGSVHKVRVDVDGADRAVAEDVAHQGGVVAGARPDLQHAGTVVQSESVEHADHQGRLCGRGDGGEAAVAVGQERGDERDVAVGGRDDLVGDPADAGIRGARRRPMSRPWRPGRPWRADRPRRPGPRSPDRPRRPGPRGLGRPQRPGRSGRSGRRRRAGPPQRPDEHRQPDRPRRLRSAAVGRSAIRAPGACPVGRVRHRP